MSKRTRHFVMIVDESGSMWNLVDTVVKGFNENVVSIRKEAKEAKESGDKFKISFVSFAFNTKERFWETGVKKLNEIGSEDYRPTGGTALYDAIGYSIDKLELSMKKKDTALFLIITDGEENSSREYTQQSVADKIEKLQKNGNWTFTYLGANQDAQEVSKSLNIPVGNAMNFMSTAKGTSGAFKRMASSRASYNGDVSRGVNCSTSFYDESTTDDKVEEKEEEKV